MEERRELLKQVLLLAKCLWSSQYVKGKSMMKLKFGHLSCLSRYIDEPKCKQVISSEGKSARICLDLLKQVRACRRSLGATWAYLEDCSTAQPFPARSAVRLREGWSCLSKANLSSDHLSPGLGAASGSPNHISEHEAKRENIGMRSVPIELAVAFRTVIAQSLETVKLWP